MTLTLALRPVGAFIFGRLADHFGRRPVLMVDVLLYSVLGFATAFSPNLIVFLIIRALFGIAMGGEWGIGASLTMETVPPQARGFVSGILQSGYPTGYLLASIAASGLSLSGISAGAACSWWASRPRCSFSISAATCRNRRAGTAAREDRHGVVDVLRGTGSLRSMPSC